MARNSNRNRQAAQKLKAKIASQLKRAANKGTEAAVRFLVARVKEAVSVPAPKKLVRGTPVPGKRLGPIVGYRVTQPATSGAPPRLVSGKLRSGVTHKMLTPTVGIVGVTTRSAPSKRYPGGFNYPKHLEETDHPYLVPTAKKYRRELKLIAYGEIKLSLKGR